MNRFPQVLPIIGLLLLLGYSSASEAQEPPPPLFLFNVNIVPMDQDRVIRDFALLIRDGKIQAMGPETTLDIPPDVVNIDGQGGYLIPGLWDMHVHAYLGPEEEGSGTRQLLATFLANGVTGIRVMWGNPHQIAWRERIEQDEVLGPRLVLGGEILEGEPPPEFQSVIGFEDMNLVYDSVDAAEEVRRQYEVGYDFIKVYNNIPLQAYIGIMAEARRLGIPVDGHVPLEVGLERAVAMGQRSVEHLRGYISLLASEGATEQPGRDLRSRALAWAEADVRKIDSLAHWTEAAGFWNCPTLSIRIRQSTQETVDRYLQSQEAQYLTVSERAQLENRGALPWLSNFSDDDFAAAQRGHQVQDSLIRAIVASGSKILAGTDASPRGFVLHRELEELVQAGLSPFQALQAATVNPAILLALDDGSGYIQAGARADLVLLGGNPLESIQYSREIRGLVLKGRWFSRDSLNALAGIQH